ncbi:MAG: tRNA pseudouridine(55) synthase TruB [Bacillota bacterium]|nr:tRNA pseudouridine(55) synthase TruB [Bacillota bacterium]
MYSGIITVDKPKNFTSHDVISVLRGIFHMKRIGHSGTLDPIATGVLAVFLGSATKGCEYALHHEKEYIASFRLGIATDTQDITGEILKTAPVDVSKNDVEKALYSFLGEISQLPPMYSALKKNGKKLYEYARRGETVEREPRKVVISEAELLNSDLINNIYQIRIRCSSGTYIRTLCSDIGETLGCHAVMTDLRRTRSGMFTLDDALSLNEIEKITEAGEITRHIKPVDTLFREYPGLTADEFGESRVRNGAFLPAESVSPVLPEEGQICRVYSEGGAFLMLGRVRRLSECGLAVFSEKNFFG